jgi:hypothetical protein
MLVGAVQRLLLIILDHRAIFQARFGTIKVVEGRPQRFAGHKCHGMLDHPTRPDSRTRTRTAIPLRFH